MQQQISKTIQGFFEKTLEPENRIISANERVAYVTQRFIRGRGFSKAGSEKIGELFEISTPSLGTLWTILQFAFTNGELIVRIKNSEEHEEKVKYSFTIQFFFLVDGVKVVTSQATVSGEVTLEKAPGKSVILSEPLSNLTLEAIQPTTVYGGHTILIGFDVLDAIFQPTAGGIYNIKIFIASPGGIEGSGFNFEQMNGLPIRLGYELQRTSKRKPQPIRI